MIGFKVEEYRVKVCVYLRVSFSWGFSEGVV